MFDPGRPPTTLLNRDHERDTLDRLVADVRAGRSRALMLRGEAGVGKTPLPGPVRAAAHGCPLTRAAGVEAEGGVPFPGRPAPLPPPPRPLPPLPGPPRDAPTPP